MTISEAGLSRKVFLFSVLNRDESEYPSTKTRKIRYYKLMAANTYQQTTMRQKSYAESTAAKNRRREQKQRRY